MTIQLKPISEQVMVITGASSGIGLVTARMAARRGASIMLAARNERDLETTVRQIRGEGGRAAYAVADVAEQPEVEALAQSARREFGRIDTWVNNAGVGVYGTLSSIPLKDMRRQFDVNYWGVVHGCLAAVPHLRENGGAIINVASALADRAVPLQGNYCATKHAVKAFTDALRMELNHEMIPISLSLVKPGSTDTPLFDKARSYMDKEPQPIPPVYRPETVAEAILTCAQRPVRDVFTNGMGKLLELSQKFSPGLTDRYMERSMFEQQKSERASEDKEDNLYAPVAYDGGRNGRNWTGRVKRRSLYANAVLHPREAAVAGALAGLVLAWAVRRLNGPKEWERLKEWSD
jgi:short-subunit dehydrogenase